MPAVRPPAVAGSFYPAESAALRAAVERHLGQARANASGAGAPPKILVVPHAGYVYSGATAARGYALLGPAAARIRRVVLFGPVHRVPVRGLAAPSAATAAHATPLGAVRIDHEAMAPLRALPQVVFDDAPHAPEYSLEVQLPFLQTVLGESFGLVPLAVGDASPEEVAGVMDALWGGDETLFVISTDLSHFHAYDDATRIDRATVDRVLQRATDLHPREACGARGLNGALLAARRRDLQPALVDVCNSGDTAGPKDRVVGYGAFAIPAVPGSAVGLPVAGSAAAAAPGSASLGTALLLRARNAIAQRLGLPGLAEPAHPGLAQRGSTFVTLNDAQHRLRGCIGRLEAVTTLEADVRHNAVQAAFADPRFRPVQHEEWPGLRLEVSVLTPSEPLPAAPTQELALQGVEPGAHGLILEWRGHRATFLPQVWEQLPQPEAFMAALKRKAGLAPDFWAADLKLWRYRVSKHDGGPIAALAATDAPEPAPTPTPPPRRAGATPTGAFGSVLGGGFSYMRGPETPQ
jgi:AmmeMemoRadiSam system protein B/AmmeMemoRadiSam system protein A